jgi:LmbE family N-acetylglucosaminyl deacetylase
MNKNLMKFKKILALAPHTDDIELGCGGLLSRFKNEAEIDVIAFTAAQPLSEGNPVDECKNAMKLVGANVEFLNFEPRVLNIQRQRVLDTLWKRNQEKQYDVVFCPSSYDNHQDHKVVYEECFRAFKKTTILGYELLWNCRTFRTDVFVPLQKKDLELKFKMLDCYKTQGERVFMSKEYIYDIARTRGLQIGKKYAEAYEAIRIVI